jgi:hypothetical protein
MIATMDSGQITLGLICLALTLAAQLAGIVVPLV